MLRDVTRGKGEVSHTLPSLKLSPPSFHHHPSPLLSPPLSQRHVRMLCHQTVWALSNWCTVSCCFLPSPFFCSPNYSPLVSSLHCLHSSPLYFPLPSLYSFILSCTFSSGGYKGRSCWRERACVISGCTWATESYCFSWKSNITEDPQTSKGQTLE